MAVAGKKISQYPTLSAPTSNTKLVVEHNGNTYSISVNNLFANNANTVSFGNSANLSVQNLIVGRSSTPANSSITVLKGSMWFDTDYLYVATANNVLKRVALSSF